MGSVFFTCQSYESFVCPERPAKRRRDRALECRFLRVNGLTGVDPADRSILEKAPHLPTEGKYGPRGYVGHQPTQLSNQTFPVSTCAAVRRSWSDHRPAWPPTWAQEQPLARMHCRAVPLHPDPLHMSQNIYGVASKRKAGWACVGFDHQQRSCNSSHDCRRVVQTNQCSAGAAVNRDWIIDAVRVGSDVGIETGETRHLEAFVAPGTQVRKLVNKIQAVAAPCVDWVTKDPLAVGG